ncbi:MAG: hypothetical protein ABIG34_03855 [Candidatus Peregrinibacteria bacterium]
MFENLANDTGNDEIEAKILGVDTEEVQQRLREAGAIHEGNFFITEQRYCPTDAMREKGLSGPRLRRLTGVHGEQLELTIKQKLPSLVLPSRTDLGPKFKRRTEHEFIQHGAAKGKRRYQLMQSLLDDTFTRRGDMLSARTRFVLGAVRVELDHILSCDGSSENLPPPFLEIEGPTPQTILEVARAIGYKIEDLCALTKQDVIEAHRQGT